MGYASQKKAAEQTDRMLRRKLSPEDYNRLIKGKPAKTTKRNTGKSTYRKRA